MDTFGYIYKTTNLINGRFYIGQKRGSFLPSYLGSGVILHDAIKKYGKINFKLEVLNYASTKEMLDGLEMKHIFEHRQVFGKAFLYNISNGGEGCIGFKHSEEFKMYQKEKHLGMKMPPRSAEHCEKIRLLKLGKKRGPISKEWANKISASGKGKKKPGTGIALKGRKRPPRTKEWCEKISIAKKKGI